MSLNVNKTMQLVYSTFEELNSFGNDIFLIGGWAEELRGNIKPRLHGDIDLMVMADNFNNIDGYISANSEVQEIFGKRFPHKRAFLSSGVMVEVILVQTDNNTFFTDFWDKMIITWPLELYNNVQVLQNSTLKVGTQKLLQEYRNSFLEVDVLRKRILDLF